MFLQHDSEYGGIIQTTKNCLLLRRHLLGQFAFDVHVVVVNARTYMSQPARNLSQPTHSSPHSLLGQIYPPTYTRPTTHLPIPTCPYPLHTRTHLPVPTYLYPPPTCSTVPVPTHRTTHLPTRPLIREIPPPPPPTHPLTDMSVKYLMPPDCLLLRRHLLGEFAFDVHVVVVNARHEFWAMWFLAQTPPHATSYGSCVRRLRTPPRVISARPRERRFERQRRHDAFALSRRRLPKSFFLALCERRTNSGRRSTSRTKSPAPAELRAAFFLFSRPL